MIAKTTAVCVKGMEIPRVERVPQEPRTPERREERDACDRRRQHERQLDQREHERAPAEPPRRDQVGGRSPEQEHDGVRDHASSSADDERVDRHLAR